VKIGLQKQNRDDWAIKPAQMFEGGFTLVEVMIVLALSLTLIVGGFNTVMYVNYSSRRMADYTAASAVVGAKMEAVRAATYAPPSAYFGTNTVMLTNNDSISLSKSGTNLLIRGTLITQIKPVVQGHLVTVTGTFTNPAPLQGPPFSVTMQTVVNRYSGGDQ
jgi:prepilin-type N-terminal cleavage/methylation domain-containing protein